MARRPKNNRPASKSSFPNWSFGASVRNFLMGRGVPAEPPVRGYGCGTITDTDMAGIG